MSSKKLVIAGLGLFLALAVHNQRGHMPPIGGGLAVAADEDSDRAADREVLRAGARQFVKLFDKGDAKGLAGFWTATGEYQEEGGEVVRGQAAIEETFRAFFKENTEAKLEIHIESIRFLGKDCAVEEGLLRQIRAGSELPGSTQYSAIHVREGGAWKMALCREWGADQHRLVDLHWLLGEWQGAMKEEKLTLTFEQDKKRPFILGHFTRTSKGKTAASGDFKITLDPQRGQLRSWHFDDDGGHGQALWVKDGNRWVLDAVGVLADGTEIRGVNVLTRLSPDELTWRSIDRVAGGEPLPDTIPVKLKRTGKNN